MQVCEDYYDDLAAQLPYRKLKAAMEAQVDSLQNLLKIETIQLKTHFLSSKSSRAWIASIWNEIVRRIGITVQCQLKNSF